MWRSDGSTPGTYVIKKERLKDNNYYNLDKGIVLKNKIYFPFEDSVSGNELWCSDGTEDGTYMVGEVNIGISSSELNEFNTNGKEIFFTAYSEFYGTEWYKYIPSAAPSTQTSGVEFFNVRTKQFSLKWKRGNGDKSLVFIKKGNSGAAIVHDNSNYIPSNVYPFGERSIDPQWFCVYNGIDTIITVYGLQPGTEYRVMAIGYNESEGGFYYNSSMSYLNPNNQYTLMDREGNENLEINYFPNPTAGKVYILNSQNSRIFLYNYTGKLIFDIQVQEEPNIIDLSQYPNGMYFLKIVTGSKSITKKVILYKLGG
jgi:ELWxxDGT repeat protein